MLKGIFTVLLVTCSFLAVGSANAQALLNHETQAYIRHNHWHDHQGTAHFYPSVTMKRLDSMTRETIKKGTFTPATQGRKTHQYTFKKAIGINSMGHKSFSLRVVTDQNGEVLNAFPV